MNNKKIKSWFGYLSALNTSIAETKRADKITLSQLRELPNWQRMIHFRDESEVIRNVAGNASYSLLAEKFPSGVPEVIRVVHERWLNDLVEERKLCFFCHSPAVMTEHRTRGGMCQPCAEEWWL
jgi:hypothetical protein